MHRPGRFLLVALLAFLSPLAAGARAARAGGVPMPEALPPYWITVKPGPGAEILQFLKTIPQDPNPLGVRAALFRTKEYPYTFTRITFPSADGTPLVGRWSGQRYPRPGVVLVHGFTQSKEHKFILELAEMFSRNGWSVLAFDLRDHGETRRASKAPFTNGWKEADDILAAVRALRTESKATSISVVGFSFGRTGPRQGDGSGHGRDRGRHRRVRAAWDLSAGGAARARVHSVAAGPLLPRLHGHQVVLRVR